MKESIKLGAILLIISAVSGLILAIANNSTAPIIAKQQFEETLKSYEEIYGEQADTFELYDEAELAKVIEAYPEISNIFIAKKGEDIIGYGINFKTNGFGGEMENAVGFLLDDTMAGFRNISNGETAGFGSKISEEPYFSTFIGKTIAGPLQGTADGSGDDAVMSISGATVTSNAVLDALNNVIEAYHNEIVK